MKKISRQVLVSLHDVVAQMDLTNDTWTAYLNRRTGELVTVTYAALEVARVEVNREDFSSKEGERAGRIPDEMLDAIQRILLTEFTKAGTIPAARKPDPSAGAEGTLELVGRVVDFLPGSMGAGQQKIEVECFLKDRKTGAVLAHEIIRDRKVGGVAGGSEDKGVRDFAEKVVAFVQEGLGPSVTARAQSTPALTPSPGTGSGS
jgi:hypothetical protein